MDEERVFYHQAGITVTNARFVVGAQTFAMRNITSVRLHVKDQSNAGEGWVMAFGIAFALIGFSGAGGLGFGVVGLAVLCTGIYLIWNKKRIYQVVLTTSAGETSAYQSTDQQLIADIVKALNDSMVARG
ncbi:MAG: DUF6232 family protein [Betaproteobacteria bacterium]